VGQGQRAESSADYQSATFDVSRRPQAYRRHAEGEMGEVEAEAEDD